MRFECRAVDATFFETAPLRFVQSAELPVEAPRAFAALEDPGSWPVWFQGIRRVEWTTPRPFGVGTTRTVTLASATVFEHFFRWDAERGFSFYLVGHRAPVPLFRALAEDYQLDPVAPGRCRFTYRVAIDPSVAIRLTSPIARRSFAAMFSAAPEGLAAYLGSHGVP